MKLDAAKAIYNNIIANADELNSYVDNFCGIVSDRIVATKEGVTIELNKTTYSNGAVRRCIFVFDYTDRTLCNVGSTDPAELVDEMVAVMLNKYYDRSAKVVMRWLFDDSWC